MTRLLSKVSLQIRSMCRGVMIFPLYFVVGAVYCGFGMVLVLLIPLRKPVYGKEIIPPRHIDRICKLTLLSSLVIAYIYVMEYFIAWYSGDPYERWVFGHRSE